MLLVLEDSYSTEFVELDADNYPFKNKKSIETWKYGSHFRLIVQALLNDLEKKTPSYFSLKPTPFWR